MTIGTKADSTASTATQTAPIEKPSAGARSAHLSIDSLHRDLRHYYLVGNYPPLVAMRNVESLAEKLAREFASSISEGPVDMYLHFPFCKSAGEKECTFCHFYKERYGSALEAPYVQHMIMELEEYARASRRLTASSLYFGGGTFSLISPRNLRVLVEAIRRLVVFADDIEVKFEVHADAARDSRRLREILTILKDLGTTHIVVDIQTLNQRSLDSITHGRLTVSDYFETLDVCMDEGFNQFVTGLIVGLPHEDLVTFRKAVERLRNIEEIVTINAFPLMFRPGDLVWDQLRGDPGSFPSVEERDVLSASARACLSESFGFREGPIYFHNRCGTTPKQQTDKFEGKTLIGIGPSAFGLYRQEQSALQYFNVPDISRYMERVRRGVRPLWYAGRLNRDELARRQVIFGLNLIRPVDLQSIDLAFGTSLSIEYREMILRLADLGLAMHTPEGIQITDQGLLRAEEISLLFCSTDVLSALASDPAFPNLLRYNYFPRPTRQFLAEACKERTATSYP